jgi:hypothetical protein
MWLLHSIPQVPSVFPSEYDHFNSKFLEITHRQEMTTDRREWRKIVLEAKILNNKKNSKY